MNILSFVKAKKQQFQAYKEANMNKKELETTAKLNSLKVERQKLEGLRLKERELRSERNKLRELKREPLDRVLNNVKGLKERSGLKGTDQKKNPFNNQDRINVNSTPKVTGGPLFEDPKGSGGVMRNDKFKRIKGL